MKQKAYELMKNIRIQQILGAGHYFEKEGSLATELFCELNNIDTEKYMRSFSEKLKANQKTLDFLRGQRGSELATFSRALIDDLTKEFIKEE